MTNQSEQAKGLTLLEAAREHVNNLPMYLTKDRQETYYETFQAGAQWHQSQLDKELERMQSENTDLFHDVEQLTIQRDQLLQSQPGIKQWVSEQKLYDILVDKGSGNPYDDNGETLGYYEGKHLENFVSLILDAPGIEDGKYKAIIQHQHLRHPETNTEWKDCDEDDLDYLSEFGDSFRRIWKLPTPNSTITPKSDMVSKAAVIDILDEYIIFSDKVIAKSSNQIIQECITKINEI